MPSTGITPEMQRYNILQKVKESFEVDLEKTKIILQVTKQLLARQQLTGAKLDQHQQMGIVMAEAQITMTEQAIEQSKQLLFEAYEKAHGNQTEKR